MIPFIKSIRIRFMLSRGPFYASNKQPYESEKRFTQESYDPNVVVLAHM